MAPFSLKEISLEKSFEKFSGGLYQELHFLKKHSCTAIGF